jgi:hypothetical protein
MVFEWNGMEWKTNLYRDMLEIKNIHKIVGSQFKVYGIDYEFYSFNDYPGRYQYWFWIKNKNTNKESRLTLDRRDYTLTMDKIAGRTFTLNIGDVKSSLNFVETVERILNYHI